MFNTPVPPASELPTPHQLLRSTAIAVVVAGLLLVTVVLPAEYGVDPTGVGNVLGLKRMGEIKMALAQQAAADAAANAAVAKADAELRAGGQPLRVTTAEAAVPPAAASKSDLAEIVLQPDEAKAIRLVMREGASVNYEWWTDAGTVSVEVNGARANAASPSHSYSSAASQDAAEGTLVAAFDGLHGWVWRNTAKSVVTVTLHVQGDYQELKQVP